MVVERDDGRSCAPHRRLAHEMLEEIDVAQVKPVEDADDDEQRVVGRRQASQAPGGVHRHAPTVAGRSVSTLWGWRMPPTARHTATIVPSGPTASTAGASGTSSGLLGPVGR